MSLHGKNFIAGKLSANGSDILTGFSPLRNEKLDTQFHIATDNEVDMAVTQGALAVKQYVSAEQRAAFLNAAASNLLNAGEDILEVAHQETALPIPRLTGERMRTVNQLKMFASLIEEGSWVDARIDLADPDRQPIPRPDLRRMLTPIGPVAVFGASNFPFAYSVAGGDTASAFGAGCAVIVKAHPAHPGTSELTADAIARAVKSTGMPAGIFSMLHGESTTGQALIKHPQLAAAGFTGSLAGGRALFDAASARPMPIPVHSEMGSVNPVFLLPTALEKNLDKIASGLSQSVTLGTGQFCVNPGIVLAIEGPALRKFVRAISSLISTAPTFPMLTPRIGESYMKGLERLASAGAHVIAKPDSIDSEAIGAVFETDLEAFLLSKWLSEEVFGPVTMVVSCKNDQELEKAAESFAGQLTGTIHAEPEDIARYISIIRTITSKVGRVIFNGYPTNVEVVPSMQHGGPYPATSDSRFTSVGTAAIFRFSRPVCWQNAPDSLLPRELQNANPAGISRLINGVSTREPVK
jgi:NADP-dependent aldehyde dehydrogenase